MRTSRLTEQQIVTASRQVANGADNVSEVSPAIEAAFSIKGETVVAVPDRLKATVGPTKRLAVGNGPEFTSEGIRRLGIPERMTREASRPREPTDTAFVEPFNGHFRAESLDQHRFASLEAARWIIEAWRIACNTERPHQALKYGAPTDFAAAWEPPKEMADEPIERTNSGFGSTRGADLARYATNS